MIFPPDILILSALRADIERTFAAVDGFTDGIHDLAADGTMDGEFLFTGISAAQAVVVRDDLLKPEAVVSGNGIAVGMEEHRNFLGAGGVAVNEGMILDLFHIHSPFLSHRGLPFRSKKRLRQYSMASA